MAGHIQLTTFHKEWRSRPAKEHYVKSTVITLCTEPKQGHKNNVYNPLSSTTIMEVEKLLSKTRDWAVVTFSEHLLMCQNLH